MGETLYLNGSFYTMAREGERVEAMAVWDGKIAAIGTAADLMRRKSDEVVDLQGRTVLPGFIDSHMHPGIYAESLGTVDLSSARSIGELQARLGEKAAQTPAGQWVRGVNFDHEKLREKRFPTASDLDAVSDRHPILLSRCCLHAFVANGAAMGLVGIEPADGLLLEDAADPVFNLLECSDTQDGEAARFTVLREFSSYGITGISALENDLIGSLAYYRSLNERGMLPVRVAVSSHEQPPEGMLTGDGDNMVRYGFLKMLCDGSLGAGTAFLRKPYADGSGCGIALYSQRELNGIVAQAHGRGLQVGLHAIGDGALDMVATAIEQAIAGHRHPDPRFRVIHATMADDGLIERFAKLPVVMDVQPKFLSTDIAWIENRLGTERSAHAFAWRTMLRRGLRLAAGSDLPVEPCNPMLGIAAAVTRRTLDGWPKGGWHSEERLTVYEAVSLFTRDAAYASFEESRKGTLEPGKLADFITLDDDPFAVAPERLADIAVEGTWLGGRQVFRRA